MGYVPKGAPRGKKSKERFYIVDTDIVENDDGDLFIKSSNGNGIQFETYAGLTALEMDGATGEISIGVGDIAGDIEATGANHATTGQNKVPLLAIGEWDAGAAKAPVVASATGVNTTTEVLTSNAAHGFTTGDCVNATTSNTLPTGISVDTAYYVRVISPTTFTLYDTRARALSGGATGLVDITAAGTGNQTFTSVTAIGQHYLGVTLPDNALVIGGGVEVITGLGDGSDDSATVALQINGANDLVTATAISAGGSIWDAGNHDIVPDSTGSTAVKLTAARELLAVIADDQIPTGKFRVWLSYIQGV